MTADDASAEDQTLLRKAVTAVGVVLFFTAAVISTLLCVPALVSPGLLAYSFGLRHAVDADHIAAIDNVTRRLTVPGRTPPATVGLFFALGHSIVVTIMCGIVAVASGFMVDHLKSISDVGAILGASISGSFLLIIGAINVYSAWQLCGFWQEASRYGGHTHAIVGMCTTCCPMLFDGIKHPWQMIPVGFLFGLGFDTSSEIGLLAIVAMSHHKVAPGYIMLLPLMFMGGMCLLDALNGILMAWAYGRALQDDMQRLYYNLTLTATSGLIAVAVGTIVILGAFQIGYHLHGGFWNGIAYINDHFEILGYVVIGIFALSLAISFGCFRVVFPGGRPREEPGRANLMRYIDTGNFIDRSGV